MWFAAQSLQADIFNAIPSKETAKVYAHTHTCVCAYYIRFEINGQIVFAARQSGSKHLTLQAQPEGMHAQLFPLGKKIGSSCTGTSRRGNGGLSGCIFTLKLTKCADLIEIDNCDLVSKQGDGSIVQIGKGGHIQCTVMSENIGSHFGGLAGGIV